MGLLEDKAVVITGASRGIGRAIAQVFVREGAKVVLSARSSELEDLARELGPSAVAVQGDISQDEHCKALVLTCRKQFSGVDVLVNNAGILNAGLLGMVQMADVRAMFEVNVLALINLTQYAVRAMNRSTNPSIVNISSIAGTQGIEGITAYSASKAAVAGFTRAAAKELASKKIRVNAIAPGFIDTDMARQVDDAWFQQRVGSVRLGQIGKPIEIAESALFLASDLATHVTGQILGVDGGMQV